MKKTISTILLIGFVFFLTGCVAVTIPAAEVVDLPPKVVQKVPLKCAVVVPSEVEHHEFTGKPVTEVGWNITATFPLGQMLKKSVGDSLSAAFEGVTLVTGEPYPEDAEILIFPVISDFQYGYEITEEGVFDRAWLSTAKATIKLSALSRNGILLFEDTISSGSLLPREGKTFNPNSSEAFLKPTGRAAAESIAAALRDAAKRIATAPEMNAYASKKEGQTTPIATLSHEPLAVRSELDSLPTSAIKSQLNAYAIVIGVEDYRQKLPRADFAVADARLVNEYLTKTMGYPEENVVLLTNEKALQSDLSKYFEKWLRNNVEKDSIVFIYYSGHGAPNPKTGDAYLVPYDGDPSFIEETGYSLQRLYTTLGKLPAKQIVVALDSCFSGAGGRSVLAKGARPIVIQTKDQLLPAKNLTVLSASSGDQISSTYDEKGHGLFTYFLLKGIKHEDVISSEGSLRVDDLYAYLKPQVERVARKQYNNEQTPQLFVSK